MLKTMSHSQQKVLQGLRRSAVSTMRNSNSSAWMINSLCVLCAEIQKNMSITDSAPINKVVPSYKVGHIYIFFSRNNKNLIGYIIGSP